MAFLRRALCLQSPTLRLRETARWRIVDHASQHLWWSSVREHAGRIAAVAAAATPGSYSEVEIPLEPKAAPASCWRCNGATPLDERNVRRAFHGLLRVANLPEIRIHDLRHTCATLLLAQGVHVKVVQEILGLANQPDAGHVLLCAATRQRRSGSADGRRAEGVKRLVVRLAVNWTD
jgi:hypothetical protein